MKKHLSGLVGILLAIGLSSFTERSAFKKSPVIKAPPISITWFSVDLNLVLIGVNSISNEDATFLIASSEYSPPMIACSGGSYYCLVGFTMPKVNYVGDGMYEINGIQTPDIVEATKEPR